MPDSFEYLVSRLKEKKLKLVTAESCTGGQLASLITGVPGASAIFERGFVTYSNESKMDMLDVLPETLIAHGAVSEQTAGEMAVGALKNSRADLALSITGIAGPSGGSEDKPVGLVYLGFAAAKSYPQGYPQVSRVVFPGNRPQIQAQATAFALQLLLNHLEEKI